MLKIVRAFPPNIAVLQEKFGPLPQGVMFTYGDTLYRPNGEPVPREIIAHEEVHSERQGTDPATWWEHWIADKPFRYAEELLGHAAEWRVFRDWCGSNRARRRYLDELARRMAHPMYGGMVSAAQAKEALQAC